jgi:hypothetical protein
MAFLASPLRPQAKSVRALDLYCSLDRRGVLKTFTRRH